jgi:hypothetical protein
MRSSAGELPMLELLETCWRLKAPSGRDVSCASIGRMRRRWTPKDS